MVISALKTNAELTQFPPSLIPGAWAWQNFVDAVNYIPFGLYTLNSLTITVGATIGAVLSNTLVAYGFSRIQWPGRNVLFYICVATIFLPYPVILVALFDIFGKLPSFGVQGAQHWVNTFLPLIVPAFFGNPFYIFLMRQFMLGIPRELSDAARVDGASEIRTFWNVILPLTKPAVVVVAILAAVAAWNEFLLPLLYLQENDKYPLAVGLVFFTSEHDVSYNLLMAASTLIVLPVVILFIFAQRFFIEGITVGGVKG
ncbi:MAG: carbohydrate ABC transporter permease [Chloroflexi bacterium]|nr:MAG: carbohydrate ABC transporter permease [Chloroflexota bacterium]